MVADAAIDVVIPLAIHVPSIGRSTAIVGPLSINHLIAGVTQLVDHGCYGKLGRGLLIAIHDGEDDQIPDRSSCGIEFLADRYVQFNVAAVIVQTVPELSLIR